MTSRQDYIETRRNIGMTQRDVANAAQISLLTVINWEAGKRVRPSTDFAIRSAISAKNSLYRDLISL